MRALLIFALLFLFATNLFASNVGIETVANDIWDKDKRTIRVAVSPESSIIAFRASIDMLAHGTWVVLTADSTPVKEIILRASYFNTKDVFVGGPTSGLSFALAPSRDAITLRVDNAQDIYFTGGADGLGIDWIGLR